MSSLLHMLVDLWSQDGAAAPATNQVQQPTAVAAGGAAAVPALATPFVLEPPPSPPPAPAQDNRPRDPRSEGPKSEIRESTRGEEITDDTIDVPSPAHNGFEHIPAHGSRDQIEAVRDAVNQEMGRKAVIDLLSSMTSSPQADIDKTAKMFGNAPPPSPEPIQSNRSPQHSLDGHHAIRPQAQLQPPTVHSPTVLNPDGTTSTHHPDGTHDLRAPDGRCWRLAPTGEVLNFWHEPR